MTNSSSTPRGFETPPECPAADRANVRTLDPRRTHAVLLVVALSLMTVVSAVSGLNVALPGLARDTGASQTQLTWIVDAYTVVFAGLLLFAGALGDRFGRKGLLVAGLLLFGGAAASAMTTNDPNQLIALRALMGAGAAAIMPTTLSVITTSFPEAERPRAIGVWVGVAGGGAVLGLFGTGILLNWFPWSSFFALNVTLATLALVGTILLVPSSVDPGPPRLDGVGAVLSLVAVSAGVAAIIEGPERGWADPLTVTGLVIGLVAGVSFVLWELRRAQPMLDPHLFHLRGFSAGAFTIAAQFFAAFGFFFIVMQYLQLVLGYSALRAATALLPMPIVLLPLARRAPMVAQRIGFRRVAPVGLLLMAAGFLVISQVGVEMRYPLFATGLVLFATGMALAGTPATTAITASLPPNKQGVASAVNDTSRELGSALGIALLGSVLNQAYRSHVGDALVGLPDRLTAAVKHSVAFTQSPQLAHAGEPGRRLVDAARHAFVDGVSTAMFTAAAVLTVAAVVVALRSPSPSTRMGADGEGARAEGNA